ncbi:MAG: GTPase HflX [Hyphomicrobiaceae bacterium]
MDHASSSSVRALVLVPVPTNARANAQRRKGNGDGAASTHAPEERLSEATGLAAAIDLDVVEDAIVPLPAVRPSTLFGAGKVDELGELIGELEIQLAVVDHALTPIQQRNLERAWNCKVLDRTGLILEIFGRRARTREGRLQVELAHLTFQRSRLVRSWTHLERQRGGFGFLGGPGETQIETDRRLLQERIQKIRTELAKVTRTRALHRKGRQLVPYPVIAIVGYTNAGKSSLFNRLTGSKVLAKDQVFATLDPTMRELVLESGRRVILSDTVGFISDLPTMLVAAFRATLEEVIEADLILHVRDISHPESEAQCVDVENVLRDLLPDADGGKRNSLEVWNKVDQLTAEERALIETKAGKTEPAPILLSALTGEGCDRLIAVVDEWIGRDDVEMTLSIPHTDGRLLSWLYENARVVSRDTSENGDVTARIRIANDKVGRLEGQLKASGVVGG